jgi:hypothetical protein
MGNFKVRRTAYLRGTLSKPLPGEPPGLPQRDKPASSPVWE